MSQENTTVYQVFYNNMMMNISSSTVFTFILQPLLDDVRIDTVSVNIIAINRCGLILGIDSDSEPINGNDIYVYNIAHILYVNMIETSECLL